MDEDIKNSKNKDQNGNDPPNYFIIIAATEMFHNKIDLKLSCCE